MEMTNDALFQVGNVVIVDYEKFIKLKIAIEYETLNDAYNNTNGIFTISRVINTDSGLWMMFEDCRFYLPTPQVLRHYNNYIKEVIVINTNDKEFYESTSIF